jgi:hypothetical protein
MTEDRVGEHYIERTTGVSRQIARISSDRLKWRKNALFERIEEHHAADG